MNFSKRLGLVAVVPLVVLLALGVVFLVAANGQSSVQQPIAFSHGIHAVDNQIACVYCHQGVARSATAGLPSVEKCMGCHKTVATDKPEVQKVAAYWSNKEPIAWARVNYLPDHVYFTHQQHIHAGLECRTCHGNPRADGSLIPLQPGMSWCLDCHRARGASIDCSTCHQ
ncbi:MAG: cytochrome c family protein [Chloroflexi bacterium]|nr:cytochrome c family protein [Chloroflexota bacterium]